MGTRWIRDRRVQVLQKAISRCHNFTNRAFGDAVGEDVCRRLSAQADGHAAPGCVGGRIDSPYRYRGWGGPGFPKSEEKFARAQRR
eukprot:777192-Prymnesium_polylepis.1